MNCEVNYRPLLCCRNTRGDCGGPRGCRCVAPRGRVRAARQAFADERAGAFRLSSISHRNPVGHDRRDRLPESPFLLPILVLAPQPFALTPAKFVDAVDVCPEKRSDRDFPQLRTRIAPWTRDSVPRTRRNYKEVKLK